ncbi:TATA box-binding protein-like protein 1 [Toxocara canis]|nr:TATA box-binding protein-like protein 1 [Toxocara canis]
MPRYETTNASSCNDIFHLSVPLRDDEEEPSGQHKADSQTEANQCETEMIPSTCAPSNCVEDECESDGEIDIQIRNVVCSYTLPFHIDLRRVALNCSSVTFDRGRGVLLKQKRNPSCFAKIYSSGKVYLVGCRSEAECKRAARGVARMLQRSLGKLAEVVCMRNYRVCNVLATCKMPFGIKVEELALKYPNNSEYEPELSVGLVWRSTEPKATLRIHTTGSVTVTGAVSEQDVMKVIELIYPILREFRCLYRLRGEDAEARRRKRKASTDHEEEMVAALKRRRHPRLSRTSQSWSGAIGNRIYFSDEDEDLLDQA